MIRGTCHLCGTCSELQNSHVLPAFVYRWLRKSSPTGHIRFGTNANLRTQDGVKQHWFCSSCESCLSEYENIFANNFFYPCIEHDGLPENKYGPWLLKFCVSISWRVLHFIREIDSLDDYSEEKLKLLAAAESTWKEYLLDHQPHPSQFYQHLWLPVTPVLVTDGVAPNINRHILRHTEMDLVSTDEELLVYAKLPRFYIFGVVQYQRTSDWQGTKINANQGLIPHNQQVPSGIPKYVNSRAYRAKELLNSISDNQKKKVNKANALTDMRAWLESDTIKAIGYDYL